MNQEVIIIGAFHEVIELSEKSGFQIVGIFDNKLIGNYWGYPILGQDKDASLLAKHLRKYPLIVSPDLPLLRKKLVLYYRSLGYSFVCLISPESTISKSAKLGEGITIQDGVNISAGVTICDYVKVNSCANIMHDSNIGTYTTIAPNAVVLGRVSIGEECYIGANATILPERKIGNNVTIGAGSVVTKNVDDFIVIIGNPGKELKDH